MLARPVNPWTPWFDKTFAVIVRAIDERSARSYAQGVAGNERRGVYRAFGDLADEVAADVWLDGDYTTCTTLTEDGDPGAADASVQLPGLARCFRPSRFWCGVVLVQPPSRLVLRIEADRALTLAQLLSSAVAEPPLSHVPKRSPRDSALGGR